MGLISRVSSRTYRDMAEDNIIKTFFASNGGDDSWDTVKTNSYTSPDGSIKIHSSYMSKSWGSNDDSGRPAILSGPDQPKPTDPFALAREIENKMASSMKSMGDRMSMAFGNREQPPEIQMAEISEPKFIEAVVVAYPEDVNQKMFALS